MNVLIIPSWYKTTNNPYSGTFFEEQARLLQKRGHNVSVLYPSHTPSFISFIKQPYYNYNYISDNGIDTHYSNTKSIFPTKWGYVINSKYLTKKSLTVFEKKILTKFKPDIIHAHSVFWGGVVAKAISKKYNIPYVITEHLSTLINNDEFNKYPFSIYIDKVYKSSSKAIFVSKFLENDFLNKYNSFKVNNVVINNVVNPIFFKHLSSNHIKNKINILNIGAMVVGKNQIKLLETLILLRNNIPNVHLTIIGKGVLKNTLVKFIQNNNLTNIVKIINSANRQEIAEYIKKCHILVSTSLFETFGMTLAEACAVGRPVVSYNAGGPSDIVNNDNGVMVYENSSIAFTNAIIRVVQNYNKYDSKKIYEDCYNKFSEEVIYNKLLKVYEKILLNGKS